MTVVLTGEVRPDGSEYQLLCSKCKEPVGWVTRAEGAGLTCRGEEVLCFECEGVDPEEIHPLLWPGDWEIWVYEPRLRKFATWSVREDAGQPIYSIVIKSDSCLSSRPYLPKSTEERGS